MKTPVYLHLAMLVTLAVALLCTVPTQSQGAVTNGRIAFASKKDGDFEIYTVNPDGSDLLQLTFNDTFDSCPRWSPDGTQIAFVHDDSLFIMDADGSNPIGIPDMSDVGCPDWSSNGDQLVFIQSGDIVTLNLANNQITQITDTLRVLKGDPVWSPDGSQIAFASSGDNPVPPPIDGVPLMGIYIINPDGTDPVKIADIGSSLGSLNWSTDNHLIYSVFALPALSVFSYDLNNDSVSLLSNPGNDAYLPSLSPDETQIAFVRGGTELAIMNIDGSGETIIVDSQKNIIDIDWQPVLPSLTSPFITITIPSIDGTTLATQDDTRFQAVAYDPAVGANDGDGIQQVDFELYDPAGTLIYANNELQAAYCVFGGDAPCNTAPAGLFNQLGMYYTLKARAETTGGIWTEWVSRTFIVLSAVSTP
ncbi:MAG: PD40 domain-containing protein [Anaerolineaceae bacterium]|nr:PD40 domain-containing protein [Anaerolineaceae bacterium]